MLRRFCNRCDKEMALDEIFTLVLTNETLGLIDAVICLRCANEINVWIDSYATKRNIDMED